MISARRAAGFPTVVFWGSLLPGEAETLELLRPQDWQRGLALRSHKKQRLDAGVN